MIIILLGAIPDEKKDLISEIFSKLNVKMYNISYKTLGNKQDAEEALSETFLKIIKNIDKISVLPCPQIELYCVRILKNETINVIRKRCKVVYIDNLDFLQDSSSYETEYEFLNSVDKEILKKYIEKLSDDEKDFIHLRFFEDMKLKDIALFFDISEEAAKKRSQRIIKKLRKYYEAGDNNV